MQSQKRREGQQFGNYRLLRYLGREGFGEAYLAEHIYLGTHVAVKVLTLDCDQQTCGLIRAGAHTSARLTHPHIVQVLDFGFSDDLPSLAMTYVPNGTLRSLHPQGTILTLQRVAFYVQHMAQALQCAHDQKIVHRDVNPENMLLGPGNHLLLSDFGIAVAAHRTTSLSAQQALGTAAYMAPEQGQGKGQPASDQYSLAVCVYEWIAGRTSLYRVISTGNCPQTSTREGTGVVPFNRCYARRSLASQAANCCDAGKMFFTIADAREAFGRLLRDLETATHLMISIASARGASNPLLELPSFMHC